MRKYSSLKLGPTLGLCLYFLGTACPSGAGESLLIKWKDGPESKAAIEGNALIGASVKRKFPIIGWQSVRLPEGMSAVEGRARFLSLHEVVSAEIPRSVPVASEARPESELNDSSTFVSSLAEGSSSATLPNDPRFNSQWNLRIIGATNAWNVTTGSSNVVVAVVDSGVAYNHPDLKENMWRNPGETGLDANGKDKSTNGMDDDGNGYVDDVYGIDPLDGDGDPNDSVFHGTRCAGIIGARGNNRVGLAGLNWQVQLMAVRIWNGAYVDQSVMLEGLEYVLEMKRRGVNIRVVSESDGGAPFDSQSMYDAHRALHNAGILASFIAMNEGRNNDLYAISHGYFDYPNIIVTGATESGDGVASYSNYGRTSVDIFAPGTGIFTTTSLTGYGNDGFGTSFAGPHVAGAAALLAAAQPAATALEIKAALLHSVDQKPAFTNRVVTHGRLNVGRAMNLLRAEGLPPIVLHAAPSTSRTSGDATFEVWFSQSMDQTSTEAAFLVNPPVNGTFDWADDRKHFQFVPTHPLARTNYEARILGSAMGARLTLDGNFNREAEGAGADDFIWTFRFAPENDLFEDALAIFGAEGSVTNTTLNATWEDGAPEEYAAWNYETIGFASLWYRWTAPEDTWITFEATSTLDTMLAVYAGSVLTNLTRIAANDNDGTRKTSRVSFDAHKGSPYSITALTASSSGVYQSMGSMAVRWYPTPKPSFMTSPFLPTSGPPGSEVVLSGTNFTGASGVMFNGSLAQFRVQTNFNLVDRQVFATVPADATSGLITIVTPHGSITSTTSFQVLPPPLTVQRNASSEVEIAWAATGNMFGLETTDNLNSNVWVPVREIPLRTNGTSRVALPVGASQNFFRLRSN